MTDDKTFTSNNLQPSTVFDTTFSPTTSSLTGQLTSSIPPSSFINTPMSRINRSGIMEPKYPFNITSSLMSPPEATPHDSFARASPGPTMDTPKKTLYPKPNGAFPMSPPVSPFSKIDAQDDSSSVVVKDPILYPSQDAQSNSSQPPLFADDEALAAQRVVDRHLAARVSDMFREASPPRRGEYELALEFKSRVARAYNANRRLWFQREKAFLLEDKAVQPALVRRYHTIAPASRTARSHGGKQASNKSGAIKKVPPRPKITQLRATPEPGKRVAREDKDFNAQPDFCPPISSLPNKPNSLKVEWRGAPIDLTGDPYYNLLHQDEIHLASNLRLDCATYLTSKRRIFKQRLECLRIGKEFRKTDSQQACKIDVNKASKLWTAFDKVGWLDPKWVRRFL